VYSASKAGLVGLTKSLAKEIGGKGVTVNLVSSLLYSLCCPISVVDATFTVSLCCVGVKVAPGYIESDMTSHLDREALCQSIPAGRFGRADEVAHACEFLSHARYITGQVLGVDGGLVV
jgi:3-oxoacyl-[acyl-carrier protein] reductase